MFQSTHPRGVRPMRQATSDKEDAMFQSTHPRGVRRGHADACRTHYIVSIHAPAWGATPRPLTGFLRHKSFNPRTLVGCDWRPCWAFPSASRFQSTHPRGVRRPPSGKPGTAGLFQSTHPRGVRHAVTSASGLVSAFQSTHPRGVRHQHSQQQAPQQGGFNPRTRVGCD